jgi:hypothetical protein
MFYFDFTLAVSLLSLFPDYQVAYNTLKYNSILKKNIKNPNLKAAKVSCSLNLLLLDPDLDDLLLLQLFKLLLLGDQEVLLVGAGLLGDGVQDWGNGLKQQNLTKL